MAKEAIRMMNFAVEIKVPKRRSERIAKRLGDRAPQHKPRHARAIFARRGLETEWRQFLPSIWFREKIPDASSKMKIVYGLFWVDERDPTEDGPPMQHYYRKSISKLWMGEQYAAMLKNKLWKRRCRKRHADLIYLGRDNADHILQELKR